MTRLTVSLARDLAYNWSKKSNIEDRQKLFDGALAHAGDMVIDAWLEELTEGIDLAPIPLTREGVASAAETLMQTVASLDMGYADHDTLNMDWLSDRLASYLLEQVTQQPLPPGLSGKQALVCRRATLRAFDVRAAEAWRESAEALIDRINALDEESFMAWAEGEGARPMGLEAFISGCEKRFAHWPGLLGDVSVSTQSAASRARARLALLWGLSDAFCRVRTGER
jgi:hypothetical protein